MASGNSEYYMTLALAQAARGIGLTSPNPPVGAVLVLDDRVLGEGYHHKAGAPHAEIEALQDAISKGQNVKGATAYVTLEPCTTHGRTPPCTEALIQAGIARVVYGATDPNPSHAGAADEALIKAGVEVEGGLLQEECDRLIRPFTKWVTTGLPYVIAKVGQSLDGRLTRPKKEPQWITSEAAREHAMALRLRSDAILIGAETLRKDNPKLTLRHPEIPDDKEQPWRVIVTRSGKVPKKAHVFTDKFKKRTLLLEGERKFDQILRELGGKGITTVLVEGGGDLLGQAFAAEAVDEVFWYIAPMICGGGTMAVGGPDFGNKARSVELTDIWHESLGDNLCVHGYPVWS
jgi:diaminohydroxyphosphoribosylaminopyrimidine deaminase / 5-amino-6-(5-phosphoribosylamino)uracil reductase